MILQNIHFSMSFSPSHESTILFLNRLFFKKHCVQHIVCGVFFIPFVLCTPCCQFLLIVHFWLPLRYSLTFILVHKVIFHDSLHYGIMFLLAPLDFYIIILSNLLTMSVSDVGLFKKLAERTKIRYLRIYLYV